MSLQINIKFFLIFYKNVTDTVCYLRADSLYLEQYRYYYRFWRSNMETMTFCVPCLFGLEGLVGDELRRLELSNVRVEDRRVFF